MFHFHRRSQILFFLKDRCRMNQAHVASSIGFCNYAPPQVVTLSFCSSSVPQP